MEKNEIKKLLEEARELMYANLEENIKIASSEERLRMSSDQENHKKLDNMYKQYQKALVLYKKILEIDPGNKEALEGKENAEVMLVPTHPQQRMMSPPGKQKDYKEPKTPWEAKVRLTQKIRDEMDYTGNIIHDLFEKFKEECEQLLIEAEEYSKTHSKEETWKMFSTKIMGYNHRSKVPFEVRPFLEKLADMVGLNREKIYDYEGE